MVYPAGPSCPSQPCIPPERDGSIFSVPWRGTWQARGSVGAHRAGDTRLTWEPTKFYRKRSTTAQSHIYKAGLTLEAQMRLRDHEHHVLVGLAGSQVQAVVLLQLGLRRLTRSEYTGRTAETVAVSHQLSEGSCPHSLALRRDTYRVDKGESGVRQTPERRQALERVVLHRPRACTRAKPSKMRGARGAAPALTGTRRRARDEIPET